MAPKLRYQAYAAEIRFQGTASKVAFDRLQGAVERRRELGAKLREIRKAGGPLPLQAEQAQYAEMAMEMANLAPRVIEALQSFLVAAGLI